MRITKAQQFFYGVVDVLTEGGIGDRAAHVIAHLAVEFEHHKGLLYEPSDEQEFGGNLRRNIHIEAAINDRVEDWKFFGYEVAE